ncbi:FG-GAP repeat protein [Rubripirellula reticaptiva]|uniref:FG-GAP repeat protein n=1 Tax=Rubripirellula reticaptiva TaxID=2528013 RepID=A0A5C6EK27_9BACT|nr:FG-GAP repeat protein [Rubripirellula reticaptiva]
MHLSARHVSTLICVVVVFSLGCRDSNENDVAGNFGKSSSGTLRRLPPTNSGPNVGLNILNASEKAEFVERVRPQVEQFCGDCHVMALPSSSAVDDWVAEVEQGFSLYEFSGRTDLQLPDRSDVLKFFQYQAPEHIELTNGITGYPESPVPFRETTVRFPGNRPPVVTNVTLMDLGIQETLALVYCDIGSGAILAHWPAEPEPTTIRLATVFQPVHVESCDLDDDGNVDLVVADIGEFNANESDLGQVVWLHRRGDSSSFEKTVLLDGLGRVSDVRPGDFDGDGDTDLLVGVFGWRKTGQILLMLNDGNDSGGVPEFTIKKIDDRNGAIHVPPIDLNGDGHLDFIVLLSQEHERVEVFLNDGAGNFENELLWAAPNPAYGSSGIELVDMDGDKDIDLLYVNGDSFDRGAKAHHSVQWLENVGGNSFAHHHVCNMPGAMDATAADFDGDGDMDIVAASLLAGDSRQQLNAVDSSSLVILTQTGNGEFVPARIEGKLHQHLSLVAGDFDHNGTVDVAVGNFIRDAVSDLPDLVIHWNERQQ